MLFVATGSNGFASRQTGEGVFRRMLLRIAELFGTLSTVVKIILSNNVRPFTVVPAKNSVLILAEQPYTTILVYRQTQGIFAQFVY